MLRNHILPVPNVINSVNYQKFNTQNLNEENNLK